MMKLEKIRRALSPRVVRTGRPAVAVAAPLAPVQEERHEEPREEQTDPGARDVRDRLLGSGASPEFARAIVERVRASGATGAYAIDAAAAALASAFRVPPSPKRPRPGEPPHTLVFVGPTGAGKTTVLAKLGRKLGTAGRRVHFASLDPVGLSALESVGGRTADGDRIELPLTAARGAADLRRLCKRLAGCDALLADTPGLSPRAERLFETLAREIVRIGREPRTEAYLVLPAAASRSALSLAIQGFARFRPTAAVVTKLDETDEPGVVLEELLKVDLPVAFLCDGQDVRGHLVRPDGERFADLFLRGRLA